MHKASKVATTESPPPVPVMNVKELSGAGLSKGTNTLAMMKCDNTYVRYCVSISSQLSCSPANCNNGPCGNRVISFTKTDVTL